MVRVTRTNCTQSLFQKMCKSYICCMTQTFTHTLYLTINIFAAFNSYQHEQSTNINQPFSLTLSNKRIEEVQANGHVLCVSVRTAPKLIFCLSSCHPSSSACLLPAQNHSRTVCFKSLKFYESVPGPDPSLTIIHDLFDSFLVLVAIPRL